MDTMKFSNSVLRAIRHAQEGKTYYRKAQETGLRPEIVGRLERSFDEERINGSAESLCAYIDGFIRSDRMEAFRIFYNLCISIRSNEIDFE